MIHQVCLFLIIILIGGSDSARILAVYPTPSISHQVVFRPLTKELVKRGHEVVVITTDPEFSTENRPANLTEIDVHEISYEIWRQGFVTKTTGSTNDQISQLRTAFENLNVIFEKQILTDEVQKILNDKSKKFDLLLVESWYEVPLAIAHIYKIPVIQVSSFGGLNRWAEKIGAASHLFLYPDILAQRVVNLGIFDKISVFYKEYLMRKVFDEAEQNFNKLVRKLFGPDTPTVDYLVSKVDMLFLNLHRIWDNNRPVSSNVLYMGGLHQNKRKDLPKDLKEYLDSSKRGVVYVSFGTNVVPSTLPKERLETLVNVLSKLPYDVLWKFDKKDLPGLGDNVKIGKWFPQSDLLRHPNVKLFITQCGLQSTDESITAGVPLVGVPLLADQWYNAEMYKKLKIGDRVDMETLTEETLRTSIEKVIGHTSYRKNIEKLRDVIYDQSETPLERAVWWTEYILRHGGAHHLRSPSANLSWTEYYELKLVITLLALVLFLLSVALFSAFKVYQKYSSLEIKVKSC